jgi:hypothetical protein
MDFSDFYTDISQKAHIENQQILTQRIVNNTQSFEKEQKPHG